MLSTLPETYQFETCDDVLSSNVGAMGLAGTCRHHNLLKWSDDTLPSYQSNRAYAPHQYLFTWMASRLQGGVNLEDSRSISEDEGLINWLQAKGFPAPNTLGDWLAEATWMDVHRLRTKTREIVCEQLNHRGVLDLHVDIDAKVHESQRSNAKRTYDGRTGDCPLYVTLPEQKLLWDGLFREGDCVPKQHLASMVRTTLRTLPETLHRTRFTLDAAAWQVDVVGAFQQANQSEDRPRVHYYIRPARVSTDPSNRVQSTLDGLEDEDWVPYGDEFEWEIADTNLTVANPEGSYNSRCVIVRKPVHSNSEQQDLFPEYRYYTVATNDYESTAREVYEQYNKRGAAEDVIGELVEDGDGGRFPVHHPPGNGLLLGLNGLTHNCSQSMKEHALPESWESLTLNSLRSRLFGMAVRIVTHARQLIVKISRYHPWSDTLGPFLRGCWNPNPI